MTDDNVERDNISGSDGFHKMLKKRLFFLYQTIKNNDGITLEKLKAKMMIEQGWHPRRTDDYVYNLEVYGVVNITEGTLLEDRKVYILKELEFK